MSEDSYRGDIKEPLSLNLYGYCEGDTVNYPDITGSAKDREEGGGGGVGGGAPRLKASDILF